MLVAFHPSPHRFRPKRPAIPTGSRTQSWLQLQEAARFLCRAESRRRIRAREQKAFRARETNRLHKEGWRTPGEPSACGPNSLQAGRGRPRGRLAENRGRFSAGTPRLRGVRFRCRKVPHACRRREEIPTNAQAATIPRFRSAVAPLVGELKLSAESE